MKSLFDTIWNFATANPFYGAVIIAIVLTLFTSATCLFDIIKKRRQGGIRWTFRNRSTLGGLMSGLGAISLISLIVSVFGFVISTSWIEYPLGGKIYTKVNGSWFKNEGRVSHSFCDFVGVKICDEERLQKRAWLSDKSPFVVTYHVDEKDMPLLLQYMENDGKLRMNEFKLDEFFKQKSYKLFFITSYESLINDEMRNKVFRDYYKQFGITIDSVDYA